MATDRRRATVTRETGETRIRLELDIDGEGRCRASTGIGMLDHLIDQIARHGLFDIGVEAKGDLNVGAHHTLEDVAICLGRAFSEALGERRGIARMGHAAVPMDEALALVAVDISGRGQASLDIPLEGRDIGGLDADLVRHFLETFASSAQLTLHARLLSGVNDHHRVEAVFKALARALDAATTIDPRRKGEVPSTKGTI